MAAAVKVERTAYKRPRCATAIAGPTGEEIVYDVRKQGVELTVGDGCGRMWDRTRAVEGWWTVQREPCIECRQPTEQRVYFGGTDKEWRPLHHNGCPAPPTSEETS